MNNRIKELVKQASFEETTMTNFIAGPRQIFYGDEAHMQKFAELIAQESIVDFYRRYLDICSEEDITVQVERYVKEHYGVKE